MWTENILKTELFPARVFLKHKSNDLWLLRFQISQNSSASGGGPGCSKGG